MGKLKFKSKTVYTKTCVGNILKIYDAAIQEDEKGALKSKNWYENAKNASKDILYKLLDRQDLTKWDFVILEICGIIAALSPQKSWEENLKLAEEFILNDKRTGHTTSNVNKAVKIWETSKTEYWEDAVADILDILNGQKTKSFFLNIIYPYNVTGVTVDRHAVEIAMGRILDNHIMTPKQYKFFERCYMLAAVQIGNIMPHQLQAVTWEYWRKHKKELR